MLEVLQILILSCQIGVGNATFDSDYYIKKQIACQKKMVRCFVKENKIGNYNYKNVIKCIGEK